MLLSNRITAIRAVKCIIILLIIGTTSLIAQSVVETIQVTGTIEDISSNIITVNGNKYFIRHNTKICSQAYNQVNEHSLQKNSMVDLAYYRLGKIQVISTIKLLDLVGSGNYKSFSGRINRTQNKEIYIGRQKFSLDDFTIKIGLKLQKTDIESWQNCFVTVTALKNKAGEWTAEIIREGITPNPAQLARFTE
ncbi:MAG: hypothetical protein DWQ10_17720 [Calditrichaeota bacterium]|nr:MAG: hypothetical protein DWQ10_17720 [Calditrichota bacterium]